MIAWAYTRFGTLPAVVAAFNGVTPVVLAVIAQALWKLGRSAVKSPALGVIAALAVAALAAGANEIVVLAAAGAAAAVSARLLTRAAVALIACRLLMPTICAEALAAVASSVPFSLWALFTTFAKIGSVLFGSGYVLVAFLRADFVEHLGWLTERQLLDAIAVGQITPGPLFTTATFVGYLVGGLPGAVVATLGIFLPAFFFVALSGPLVPRLRQSPLAGAVLDGVNVASLALMVAVTWQLGIRTFTGPLPVAIGALAAVALLRYQVNATWLVAGGAVVGLIRAAL
jgi:chromate transporter